MRIMYVKVSWTMVHVFWYCRAAGAQEAKKPSFLSLEVSKDLGLRGL